MPSATADNVFLPHLRGRLLEGVTYNPANNTLLWVDIISAEVHRVYLSNTDKHEMIKFEESGESCGAIGLTENPDEVIVCGKVGVAKGSFVTGKIEYFVKYPANARLRSNDGIIDPWGNLWIGLMTDFPYTQAEGKVSPEGKLYRINAKDFSIQDMLPGDDIYIPNGLAFSEDGKKFYWTDSLKFRIFSFDFDGHNLSNRQVHVDFKELYPDFESPEPDGFHMTKNGEILSAVFSTSTIAYIGTDGKLKEKWQVPAKKPTCLTIAGKDVVVTTANDNLFEGPIQHEGDLGGNLFKFPVDLEGSHKAIWGRNTH